MLVVLLLVVACVVVAFELDVVVIHEFVVLVVEDSDHVLLAFDIVGTVPLILILKKDPSLSRPNI